MLKRKTKRVRVTDEQFVKAWQSAQSGQDAADALGLTLQQAMGRAWRLRSQGVDLKLFPGRRPPKDIAALNAAARKHKR